MEVNPAATVRPQVEVNAAPRRDTNIDSDVKNVPVDTASFSQNGLSIVNFVQEVGELPEVRPEVVGEFKSRIAGNYPPPALIDAFGRLAGLSAQQSDA